MSPVGSTRLVSTALEQGESFAAAHVGRVLGVRHAQLELGRELGGILTIKLVNPPVSNQIRRAYTLRKRRKLTLPDE